MPKSSAHLRLAARSISRRIAPLLSRTAEGSVIGTFHRSCYVELHGSILAVVDPRFLNGPLHLVVPLPPQASLRDLTPGSPAVVRAGVLELGGRWEIATGTAAAWDPRVKRLPLRGDAGTRLRERLAELQDVLRSAAPREGLARPEGRPPRAARGMARLDHALRAGDPAMAGAAARELAGLGPGLTPSGDDVLAGAMTAVTVVSPPHAAELRTGIAGAARGRTTRISEAYLEATAAGEAGEAWHNLAAILRTSLGAPAAGGHRADGALRRTVLSIVAVGETSGADMLAGFVLGMAALLPG